MTSFSGTVKVSPAGEPVELQATAEAESETGPSVAVKVWGSNAAGGANEDARADETAEKDIFQSIAFAFEENVWGAMMLLSCTLPGGKSFLPVYDKVVIVLSALIAAVLQILLILVVLTSGMLSNPYSETNIATMLQWRAEFGHNMNAGDDQSGTSLMKKICGTGTWSFEQSQYDIVKNYVGDGINVLPGYMLSYVALGLWVMAVFKEYHTIAELVSVIVELPAQTSDHSAVLEDGAITVVSISTMSRTILLGFVCVSRAGIATGLLVVGGRFIAQTPELADLVLNAIALEFVLDVDEALFAVLLPRRVQCSVQSANPLSMSNSQKEVGGVPYSAFLRHICIIAAYAALIFAYLLPFKASVSQAQLALCGGHQDFMWSQESPMSPVVMFDTTTAMTDCDEGTNINVYEDNYYPWHDPSGSSSKKKAYKASTKIDPKQFALDYAFKDNLLPVLDGVLENFKALSGSQLGVIPQCNRFNASKGWETCRDVKDVTNSSACYWPFESYQCEGEPGSQNKIYLETCWEDDESRVATEEQCWFWQRAGVPHPRDPSGVCNEDGRRLSATSDVDAMPSSEVTSATRTSTPNEEGETEVSLLRSELRALRSEVSRLSPLAALQEEVSQLRSENSELRGLLNQVQSLLAKLSPEAIAT
mmetsp:Transcript_73383/g.129474  ORF Transcript_73383/g.129474 Transcript_73383/m.129474 type:complete len:649 (-) Transcript_73383:30-1976(-)